MLTDKEIVENTWHWVVEDNLGFGFGIGILVQDGLITADEAEIIAENIEEIYDNYFMDRFGVKLNDKCPNCAGRLILRKSIFGQFIGCDQYPNCKILFKDKHKSKGKKFK
ncbi:topoisomerase DNA-binding C4 zinc finger domain-containing protein [Clostridium sporogenes]|uniref:topoisomerase DNA-binding C4 zinc finger domain-containing protein n=1 Tax=Clostridium sporogenes TaxID=1509 RepID=UPI000717A284|nr:topoisomerase DNA-binding C4 zinc finger domain-containing protein [Clostridium sporogenes]KRU40041.1 DNA topoisomerase [Clostridium sporogenes]MBY7065144.1 topoisomerase DNA-binding C4 zinc finger domain-containing protein [Clostridium sporogenes]MBY7071810.1 topoisomerase DNA-binding C4 zinc finger domain-containing protein [Clostridium sporogenes]MCW6065868.1 topoisomerase DNA-binding C4 zinc finger domain-containing protein [Clostridium sporogenes]OQP88561.1 hypothetical protein VT93_02